ncbi:SPW repeat domain-containing protein [Raineyella fluvialis]|uniref:SPW repeat-containing integral membrane domain-containing protein n=1 Tax=Raineyella fluvialis TaxID=2662261 RepID=A0A5Q2F8P4_9ACTN|nr:hypothetical protein [Raineyella fluvialis]QGF23038.1 hypothetical protein Rai3103_04445 [Raineyella fluvialis]
MKKWTRWEDYVALAAGLFTVLAALIWATTTPIAMTLMLVFGGLLIVTGILNLSMPGTPWLEYAQCAFGVLLFVSPWVGMYASPATLAFSSATWTSWIAGIIAAVVTAAAFRPAMNARHGGRMAHQH